MSLIVYLLLGVILAIPVYIITSSMARFVKNKKSYDTDAEMAQFCSSLVSFLTIPLWPVAVPALGIFILAVWLKPRLDKMAVKLHNKFLDEKNT